MMNLRFFHVVVLLLLAPMLAGCPSAPRRQLAGSGMDMFAPVTLRIHPLSRITPSATDRQVEVRLEFTDQMGDVTKGTGTLTVELRDYELLAINHKGRRLATWPVDLTTPEANRQHWDPITRTYLFRFPASDPAQVAPGRRLVITAEMAFPNQTTLDAHATLTAK